MTTEVNWAGNVTFTPRSVHSPTSVQELRELVAASDWVRALGTAHSFSEIAATPGALVKVTALPRVVEIDAGARTVRVSAGTRYGELAPLLHQRGFALPNLGSLPHISIAGACATGTHGSGNANRSLAGSVRSVELVRADGELVTITRESPDFDGAVVSLGSLGVVTALTLDLVPAFDIEQYVYDGLPWDRLTSDCDAVFAAAYSVSVFTDWADSVQLWVKRRVGDDFEDLRWTGARPADGARHPVPGMPTGNCTGQLGVPGPWHERLPHFRSEFTPSSGVELQSEFLLPRSATADAVRALRPLGPRIAPVLHISEIRTVAADTAWLSPSHGRDSVAVHFTWQQDPEAVAPVLEAVQEALAPFDPRPHWGKIATVAPERLRVSYPAWADFTALMTRLDPDGKFRNDLVDHWFAR